MSTKKNEPARLVFFERLGHPAGFSLLEQRPHIDVRCLDFDQGEDSIWSEFADAHVYQIRSTRSELPSQYFAHEALLERCPNLLAVSTNGSGADTVDIDACTRAGVLVVNQAGGNREAVAEHAIGMMLCLSKRIMEADRAIRSVPGLARESLIGHDVLGRTLGIIGLGHVGTRTAELARGLFGMRVIATDPYVDDAVFERCGVERMELDDMLAASDYVSVHCPRNAETLRMMNADRFAKMRSHAYFITTARGGIHDEQALADALRAGTIAGAGVDVWEQEPPPLDHPLLALDNVILSPHTAGVTHEARYNMVSQTLDQIDTIIAGGRPPRLLNPQAWEAYAERYQRLFHKRPG
ncbi:MAG: hydroxyacid dehydrogenase [Gammaproteobacteria bacterium]|nr:hydroxyacid dehydrogenase [Gammaproteobacteria bacterium]